LPNTQNLSLPVLHHRLTPSPPLHNQFSLLLQIQNTGSPLTLTCLSERQEQKSESPPIITKWLQWLPTDSTTQTVQTSSTHMNYNIGGSITLIEIKRLQWRCKNAVIKKTLKKKKTIRTYYLYTCQHCSSPRRRYDAYTQPPDSAKLFAPLHIQRKTLTYTLKSSTAFTALIFIKLADVQHSIIIIIYLFIYFFFILIPAVCIETDWTTKPITALCDMHIKFHKISSRNKGSTVEIHLCP
jgi:hypothetical protein